MNNVIEDRVCDAAEQASNEAKEGRQAASEGRVWTDAEYVLELAKAKLIGPAELSHEALLDICGRAHAYFRRYWIDARPFFVELWRRLENGLIPGIRTKAEACERIGCSIRWAQMIVSGDAEKRDQRKTKQIVECEGSSHQTDASGKTARRDQPVSDADYVIDIQRFAFRKLRSLRDQQWDRCRNVFGILAADFREQSLVERIDARLPKKSLAARAPELKAA